MLVRGTSDQNYLCPGDFLFGILYSDSLPAEDQSSLWVKPIGWAPFSSRMGSFSGGPSKLRQIDFCWGQPTRGLDA